MKVKVVEIDVAKLNPKAVHLIVFNKLQLTQSQMRAVAQQADTLGVKAIYTEALDPETAIKVYEIPKEQE